jgi:hypothetical protein
MDPEFVQYAPPHIRQARQELRNAIELADEPSDELQSLEHIEQDLAEIEDRLTGVDFE